MKSHHFSLGAVVTATFLLGGCAAPVDLLQEKPAQVFASALQAQPLATCIDRNTDGADANSLRTNIKTLDSNVFEIVVRNGDFVYSVVRIMADGAGATATFYLGGAATLTPITAMARMTQGCQ